MILDDFSLEGKIALVTGANRGLGQGIAIGLAQAGADIALLSRSDSSETIDEILALGRHCLAIELDLGQASREDYSQAVNQAVEGLGRLDILVNNAGIIRRAPVVEHSTQDWDDVLKVNLEAPYFLAQAAGKHMLAQGSGKIIFICSLLSYQGGVFVPGYTASKHGVAGLTKALANEWASSGINVNGIAPGYMATDNTEALRADPERSASISSRIPAGRWGTAHDIAGAAVYLASAASDYVHGTIVDVDGGWLGR